MDNTEFTVAEMRSHLEQMSREYDLARVVDPIECRIIELHSDGRISLNDKCYGIWNADQKCVNCSSAAACRTGCPQEKDEFFDDSVFHIKSDPVTLKLPDGEAFPAVMELVRVKKDDPDTGSVNDRAAENTDHNAAEYQAVHDHLTKVLSAGPFYEKAREMISTGRGSKWVMISGDIMDFRLANTLFGVRRGNEILFMTASKLDRIAEEAGGICGRMGGDQFAMLLPEASYSESAITGAASELSEMYSSGIYTLRIHFGIYIIDDTSMPVSVMYGRSSSALRSISDDLTRTAAYYDNEMLQKSLFKQEIISGFEEALASGQITMFLQPLIREDGRIFGAEALARWHRDDGSIMMPGEFIETLERAGLIHRLDKHIWEMAARQLSEWRGTCMEGIAISVNMSAKDFFSMDVFEVITDLVRKYDVDSSLMRLEITETALLEEPEKSSVIIDKLRESGFIVEIDDFGKGHSSLSLLKDIHADVLKIDMSLLNEIESKERSRIILASVISMAVMLGMEVITEGVETEQQLELLKSMGCRCFQGFYFSPPVPVEEFSEMCRQNMQQ